MSVPESRSTPFRVTAVALLALSMSAYAAQDAVLVLQGKSSRGGPAYDGATVEFLELSLADQLVHLASPERIPLRLTMRYRVLKPAPVILNSRFGTEYWHLYHYQRESKSGLHTLECVDLSQEGEASTSVEQATADPARGEMLSKGLVGLRGRYYFLIDQPSGQWLAVARPPAFFDRSELGSKLTFTLANLSRFSLEFSAIESTWQPGGPLRVKLDVTDADGQTFPVVNAATTVEAGKWKGELSTETNLLHVPSGWLAATLPAGVVPPQVRVRATVRCMTPAGPATRTVSRTFSKGDGQKTAAEMTPAWDTATLPRNARGGIRETRALWIGLSDMVSRQGVDDIVARSHEAGLNVLVPDIFVRNSFLGKSRLMPMAKRVEDGLDPLAYLIEQAHAKGLEVHPWFCVTYRDRHFRKTLPGVDMVDAKGEVMSLGADVHRPAYRDFIVDIMVGVARDYEVDGIHLDYIRTMAQCHCDSCRKEFQARFDHPLADATPKEWVEWQRAAVGDIVRRTAEGVKACRPRAIMSAAVSSDLAGGAGQGQDPAGWARQGWLGMVIPMDYQMQTLLVQTNERKLLAALDDDSKLVTGLSLYARGGKGVMSRRSELVKEQIQLVRSMGIHGYCLFVYQYLDDDLLKMLKTEVNAERAAPYFR